MVGSMGCIGSIGLGIALNQPKKEVVVIDGDGALLMRMGVLSTIGENNPKNLLHLLIDNQIHESTGGQQTCGRFMDYGQVAKGCGYKKIVKVSNIEQLQSCLNEWRENPELTFVDIKVSAGVPNGLGRPTVSPYEVKCRFKSYFEKGV